MYNEDFLKNQKHLDDYAAKLIGDLEQSAQDVRTWLKCLISESENTEKSGTIQFPKTPLATRRTRKKPKVETIAEDDEIVQFKARELFNQSTEDSFMNTSTASSRSTRSSRTASKNAHLKISAQSKQKLNQKLRRPTRSKPGVMFAAPLAPRAKRTQTQRSNESAMDISAACSFVSARESVDVMDESIQIIESAVEEVAVAVEVNVSPRAMSQRMASRLLNAVKSRGSPDLFTDDEGRVEANEPPPSTTPEAVESTASPDLFTDDEVKGRVEASEPPPSKIPEVAPERPVPAPRTQSPAVAASQSKSPLVTNLYKVESVKKRVMAYEMLGTVSEEVSPARALTQSASAENIPMRVTRTKTRALTRQTKDLVAEEQRAEQSILQKLARTSVKRAKRISLAKQQRMQEEGHHLNSSGKENTILGSDKRHQLPPSLHTSSGKSKTTPLTNSKPVRLNVLTSANRIHVQNTSVKNLENKSSNNILSTYETFITKPVKPVVEDIEEKKREERRKREEKADEAQRKRKELLDWKREEQRKKREEKQIKALQVREAMEREKLEQKQRVEREKEEKARQLAEREEKQREEQAKRKQQAQQKAHEFEERRKQEEAARLARIREQEEEQRRAELQRKKEEAEAERQYVKRLAQEKEAAAAAAKQQVATAKKKVAEPMPAPLNNTFTLAAKKEERPPLKVESDLNYYLPDLSEGGSSSEDEHPRTKTPAWANTTLLKPRYWLQETIPLAAWNAMFSSHAQTPDLALIFNNKKLRDMKRTSSAVWRTPPRFSRMPKH